tara:strand:+ start:977 stop:2482 length:1506 start_codon:yes stop_codon:yes gene_type:complete
MKKLILLLFIPLVSLSQNWRVETKDDAFIGKTSVAFTVGYGGEFPYENPALCFRNSEKDGIDGYIIRMGSLACDNATLTFAFNGKFDDKLKLNLYPSNDNDTGYFDESNHKLMNTLVEKLKSSSYAEVLLNTDCSSNRFTISLKGSTVALNKVVKDYFKNKVIEENEIDSALGGDYNEWKSIIDKDLANIFLDYEIKDNYPEKTYNFQEFQNLVYSEITTTNQSLFDYFKGYFEKEYESLLIKRLYVKKDPYRNRYSIYGKTSKYENSLFLDRFKAPKIYPKYSSSTNESNIDNIDLNSYNEKETFIEQLTDTLDYFSIVLGKNLLEDIIKRDFEYDKKDFNSYRGLIVEPYYDGYAIDFESHGMINIYYETIDGEKEDINEELSDGLIMISKDSDFYNKLKVLSNPDNYLLNLLEKYNNENLKVELISELKKHINQNSLSQEDISNVFITANRSMRLIKSITVYYTFQSKYETSFQFKPKMNKYTTDDIKKMGGKAGSRF